MRPPSARGPPSMPALEPADDLALRQQLRRSSTAMSAGLR